MARTQLHVAMYPWFAFGHFTPYLHLANKLAQRSHRVSFFLPANTQSKLTHFNLHADLIHFILVAVPHVDGLLPPGAETTADVPFPFQHLIMVTMDLTQPDIELSLRNLKPELVFFDFAHWIPALTRRLGIKSVHYCSISSVTIGFQFPPSRNVNDDNLQEVSEDDLTNPLPGFPPSVIKLHLHEIRSTRTILGKEWGSGITFLRRNLVSFGDCDAIAFRTCRELEGPYCDYIETQFKKPVLLSGSVLPEPPTNWLEERWAKWLDGFRAGSVVYCSFGSEGVLGKDQFQELVLGLELTGLPFLAALKPPMEAETMEAALPEGFEERVQGRGVVQGGWVQQQLILGHPSIGCFVTHCGSGSLAEGLVSTCQLVLLPRIGDQVVNARLMGGDLKVGVEVEKGEEDGLFTRESAYNAVKMVMDENSEIGKEVRENHGKWRKLLFSEGLENSYIDGFIEKLHAMLLHQTDNKNNGA